MNPIHFNFCLVVLAIYCFACIFTTLYYYFLKERNLSSILFAYGISTC